MGFVYYPLDATTKTARNGDIAMAEYINRFDTIDEINKVIFDYLKDNTISCSLAAGVTANIRDTIISTIPAADVVEVVKCKDCKNRPDIGTKTKGMVWCRKFCTEVHPNGYCNYGERRTDNV